MINPIKNINTINTNSPLKFKRAFKNSLKYAFLYHLPILQTDLLRRLPKEQVDTFEHCVGEINNSKIRETKITDLQNKQGYTIEAKTKCRYDREHKKAISFNIKIDDSLETQTTRIQEDLYMISSRLKDSDTENIFYLDFGYFPYPKAIIEIKPDYIKKAELSPYIKGVYEVSKYDFDDYPESYDLLNAVFFNSTEGEPLSKVTVLGDNVIFEEEINHQNGIVSQRQYIEKLDGSYRKYKYRIREGNKTLLDTDRSWKKISDNKTITKINGKTYQTIFKDKKAITKDNEGNCSEIDFKKIAPEIDINFIKTFDADVLLDIEKYIKHIYLSKNVCHKCYEPWKDSITVDENYFTLLHEMGHAKSSKLFNVKEKNLNKKLIKIYNRELDDFLKIADSKTQEITKYFSNESKGNGIAEIMAETNALTHLCADSEVELSARGYYLVNYFPKTIAYCAKLLK